MKESQSYRLYESTPVEGPSSIYWAQISDPNELVITTSKKDNTTREEEARLSTAKAFELYCTLESSSGTTSTYNPPQNSSSSVSFSPGGSPSSQPETQSSLVIDEADDLTHKIKELETAMLGADPEQDATDDLRHKLYERSPSAFEEEEVWRQTMEMVAWGDLRGSLCACARAIDRGDVLRAEWLISELRQMVSVSGDPLQRLGAYVVEGLVARLALSGSSIYKALRCKEPLGPELLSYMHLLYEICPYFKFGYMSANGAIDEALRDEPYVHVIDFQIVQGSQWMILLRALAARAGGPPRVRITGVDDSASAYARGGGLGAVGLRLAKVAEACGVPFEFRAVGAAMADVEASDLEIRPGEAIAINFAMALHHVPDESVGGFNHRDRLLRLAKSLSPKVVTLVEQEANTNTAPFYPRFVETMDHYMAVFESIDVSLPRDHKERISIEQHCLARDIVNLIACEGPERVERHEPHGKWRARLAMAGFRPCPLSPLVNATITALLAEYNHKFGLQESDGALYLGWADKPLVVASAWR